MVRQIFLDNPAEATRVHRLVTEAPEQFAQVAEKSSIAADGGRPQAHSMDAFPEEVAVVLQDLPVGEVSPVIERARSYLIFVKEEVRPARNLSLGEARPEIHAHLLEERSAGAMIQLLADLKINLGFRLLQENLPFRYVLEEPA